MSNRSRDPEPDGPTAGVPQWQLERYLLSELSPGDAVAVERALGSSPALRQRLEEMRRDDARVRRAYPAAWMARQIEARSDPARARGEERGREAPAASAWWWRLAPVAAAAAVALAVVPALRPGGVTREVPEALTSTGPGAARQALASADPEVRLKGSPYLVLHRKTVAGSERLENGAAAYAGDLVLVQYHGAGRRYGAIVSVDGRGAVTVHLPSEGATAATLDDSGLATMGYAYELDDAPRWERFYFVTGDRSFSAAAVAEQIGQTQGAALPELPSYLELYTFDLAKDAAAQVTDAGEVDGR